MEMTRDNMCTVVGLPAMVADFKEVYRDSQPVVYYDTTFCMGDFYVSTLLYRNNVFDGKNWIFLSPYGNHIALKYILFVCACCS